MQAMGGPPEVSLLVFARQTAFEIAFLLFLFYVLPSEFVAYSRSDILMGVLILTYYGTLIGATYEVISLYFYLR